MIARFDLKNIFFDTLAIQIKMFTFVNIKRKYMKKQDWIKFTTWTGIEAGYRFDENGELIIKVFSKMPKTFYYSAWNEAGSYFDEVIKINL